MARPTGFPADGMKIQKLRRAMGKTRADLVKKSGVGARTLERIEQGGNTEFIQLEWIAKALCEFGCGDIKPSDLIRSNDEESDPPPKRHKKVAYEFVELWIDETLYASEDEAQHQIGIIAYEYLKKGKVVQIRFSSIVITYRLPRDSARGLVQDVLTGRYREFGVFDARIVRRLAQPTIAFKPLYQSQDEKRMEASYQRFLELRTRDEENASDDLNKEWTVLFNYLRPYIYRYVRKYPNVEIDDVQSEMYLLLSRDPQKFKVPMPFIRWVVSKIRRAANDHTIKDTKHLRHRLSSPEAIEETLVNALSREPNPPPPDDTWELWDLIHAFGNGLSDRDARVWSAIVQGFPENPLPTIRELAEQLHVHQELVWKIRSRLRVRFREFLRDRGYPHDFDRSDS